ncbi:MAG: hypothetical protein IK059_01180 [Firmicutes bacterium]|nr:hypothetical protein [Bacillota bacterium]
MNVNWFKNPDNVVYADESQFVDNFALETGIDNLREEIEAFRKNPTKEGKSLKGRKRVTVKLLIPNLMFDEKIDMGDNVWIYMGDVMESYCVYQPWSE